MLLGHGLDTITLEAALKADPRPGFIVDTNHASRNTPLQPIFCNEALLGNLSLHSAIRGSLNNDSSRHFQRWVLEGDQPNLDYSGTTWTAYTLQQRYRIVSANTCRHRSKSSFRSKGLSDPRVSARDHFQETTATAVDDADEQILSIRSTRGEPKLPSSLGDTKLDFSLEEPSLKCTDWTAAEPVGALTPHEIFARNIDWASTPLGPMSSWDPIFRELANLVMRNPHPCTLVWGEELTMVYNDPYRIEVAGKKHPAIMGSGFFVDFPELWSDKKSGFQECAQTGQSIRMENDRLLIERSGYLEETFFSWSWIPMYDSARRLLGFYNAPFETTYQMISSRRMETLQRLGEAVSTARSVRQFWKAVVKGLETNPYDINFATVYVLAETEGSDAASISSNSNIASKDCVLEAAIGVPSNHPAAAERVDLQDDAGLAPKMRAAIQAKEPVLLSASDGTLPNFLLEGISFRGFEIPSSEVLIVPLRSTYEYNASAILTIGLNPRRRYDKDYQTFIAMLNRQLSTSLASVLFAEDEARRNRTAAELAALQREHLTEQLELQRGRLRRMTEHSPLGMFLISPDGVLLEANDRYYEMTNHPTDSYALSFMETVAESNASVALGMWNQMTIDRKPATGDLLLRHNYNTEVDEAGVPIEPWVLVSAVPEIGPDNELRSVMGSITDMSHYHYARRLQEQRLREAEETKRQQNAFIDITSHEMRNPLSAILICAEDIKASLQKHQFDGQAVQVIAECVEAADTITLCVQHQKTIVDDVLTVSKLNSNLLLISPLPSNPVQVVQQAMNMFSKEVQSKQIDLSLHLHSSMNDLNVQWVMLDPGRVLQIMVNLLTNAIKFTHQSSTRSISVHMGASFSLPIPRTKSFDYVPRRSPQVDISDGKDWGAGSLIYLRVRVTDTGCGLTTEEKQRLFERFAQASPRTHAQYGGSGLGLFISRQLAELHGGQIGAASEAGVGSTFGFFIQCRRTIDPGVGKESALPSTTGISSLPTSTYERNSASETQLTNLSQDVPVVMPSPIVKHTDAKTIHVLVVEDNLVNQKILKKQLEKAGCVVETADNGIHALEYLRTTTLYSNGTNPISIVLMDLEMPEMGGLECVTRIRELQTQGAIRRHVPVVAVTANVRAEQILVARKSGMDDIVSKPFRMADLLEKIEAIVGHTSSQQNP
ncbi:hypothetical protein LTR84_006633 [Exophiala bonariae]|uniref:Uncharacterized protein n=1 Tax=Exophiala bonariae TaxID=1690606 RepID=A0AAV9N196_9EURO|nr:hypothetical protein LTR84_006633 [Exophiala bonariae]